jgi:methylated-DNA-[protein]-cysteine S-methyltransferase
MVIQKAYYHSPLGWLEIRATRKGVVSLEYVEEKGEESNRSPMLTRVRDQLKEYFCKSRTEFTVPLDLDGTDFQVIVWKELRKIPYGSTTTYHELACHLGDPRSDRAIGHATGQNPVNIIIPCHRVIAQDGKLTGYRGGLWRKKWLLDFENALPQMDLFPMTA